MSKWFPVLLDARRGDPPCPRAVPWEMLAPCEQQALDNHGQTLARLAERGGLCPAELLCVLDGTSWRERNFTTDAEAIPELMLRVSAWETRRDTARLARLRAVVRAARGAAEEPGFRTNAGLRAALGGLEEGDCDE